MHTHDTWLPWLQMNRILRYDDADSYAVAGKPFGQPTVVSTNLPEQPDHGWRYIRQAGAREGAGHTKCRMLGLLGNPAGDGKLEPAKPGTCQVWVAIRARLGGLETTRLTGQVLGPGRLARWPSLTAALAGS